MAGPSQARPPVDLAVANWADRINSMVAAGVKPKTIKRKVQPLIEEDIRSVSHGGQPMATDAAILSVRSAIAGRPVLEKAEKDSWSPTDVVGDFTKEVGDLTWRAVPSLARYGVNLPEHISDTAEVMSKGTGKADTKWLLAHGYERNDPISLDPSSWARATRNVAKTPVLGIIPGINTIANLTTEKGRMHIAHHPLSTALDVLPVGQAVSKAAGLGRLAEAGSVVEALAEGHPVKAGWRSLPETVRGPINARALSFVRKVGFDPESFNLSRQRDIKTRQATAEFNAEPLVRTINEKVSALPDEADRQLLWNEANYPDRFSDPSPSHAEILDHLDDFNEKLFTGNDKLVKISRTSEQTVPEKQFVMPEFIKNKVSGELEPTAGITADVTGTPNELLGWDARTKAPRSTGIMTETELADEVAALKEHRATNDPGLTRDEGGERRTVDRRAVEERRKADAEGYAEEKRQADRRLSPDQRKTQQRAERLQRDFNAKQLEDRAAVAKAAGNDELAAALRENAATERAGVAPEAGTTYTDDPNLGRPMDPEMTPEQYAKWDADMEELAQASGRSKAKAETVTRDYVYPKDSPVARTHRTLEAAEDKLGEVYRDVRTRTQKATIEETQKRMRMMDKKARQVEVARTRVEKAANEVGKAAEMAKKYNRRTARLDLALRRHENALAALGERQAQMKAAGEAVENPTNRTLQAQERKLANAKMRVAKNATKFDEEFKKNPPANMQPMLERMALDKVEGRVNMQPWALDADGKPIAGGPGSTTATYVDEAVKSMERADLHKVVTPEEWADIRRETMRGWQAVADEGYHPRWTHNVDVEKAGTVPNVRPLPDRNVRVSQIKARVGDLTPKVEDIAVSVNHAAAEVIRNRATAALIDQLVTPRTETWGQIRDFLHKEVDLMRAQGKIPNGVGEDGALQLALNKHYAQWDPDALFNYSPGRLTGTATVGETKTYIPRHLANMLDDLVKPPSQSAVMKGVRGVNKVYKTSIMQFSAKHMAHISLGGTVMLAMRGGLEELMNIGKAFKMVREGELPMELSRHLDVDTPDQLFQYAAGNKLGKLYEQSLGRVAKGKYKFDEFAANWQRADAYLAEADRATKAGASAAAAKEAGLNHAYKTLVDIDGMNPMERNVLRQVMPFYAFMRHTLRYILTYPIDHPMRAAILSRMADVEQKDWSSGLPNQLQSLFFLGSPDAKGNITGIEMRQFNPFRDTGSYFTWAGFFKSIHPAAALPFTLTGGDKFTGTSELFPELEYDPQTGNLKAKRPVNAPWTIATTIVPELAAVDYFGGLTQDMRDLKARDPEAYKARMWSMFFLPFEPKTINKPLEAAEAQANILKIAQQDVSNATRTGNTGVLQQYPVVPYQGELVAPNTLTNVLDYIKRIRPDVAPRSALPPVKLSKL